MNKVVKRHHVRASDLPTALRGDIAHDALVTVTVQEETSSQHPDPVGLLRRFRQSDLPEGRSAEAAAEDIRQQRDDWDDE